MYHVPRVITVLAVDDDPEFQEIITHYLSEDPRYTVVTAGSAQEALQIISQQSFSAIVADYQMPGMDGLDLLKTLRSAHNMIPFIIFTGQGCESVAIEALNAGADFYLVKGEDPAPQFLVLRKNLGEIVAKRQADEALRISEAKNRRMLSLLKATLDATEDGILVESVDGIISGCNERFLQLFHLARVDVQGKDRDTLLSQITSELSSSSLLDQQHMSYGNNNENLSEYLSFTDGRVIETHNRPQICEGELVGRVWSYHDLTDRIRGEQALRESRERFRILFDHSPISHQAIDANGIILEVNQTWLAMLGYDRQEVIGQNITQFCEPETIPRFRSCLFDISKGKEPRSLELNLIHKHGQVIIVIADGLGVKNLQGNILQVQCALRDITHQRRTEEQLHWTESLLKEVVDLLPFGICVTEGDEDLIRFHNAKFYDIWGVDSKLTKWHETLSLKEFLQGPPNETYLLSQDNSGDACSGTHVRCSEYGLPDRRFIRQYQRKFSENIEDTRTLWAFEDISLFKDQEDEIRTYARSLEILIRMISLSSRAKHVPSLCELTIESVVSLMNFEEGAIFLIHQGSSTAELVAEYTTLGSSAKRVQRIDTSLHPDLFVQRKAFFGAPGDTTKPDLILDNNESYLTAIPLVGTDLVLGVILLFSRRNGEISSEDKTILIGIGKEIGGAIVRLFDQDSLRSARLNLENLVNSINDMVFVIDADSRKILDINEEVRRRLGYSRKEIIGHPAYSGNNQVLSLFPIHEPVSDNQVWEHTLKTIDGMDVDVETRVTSGTWDNTETLFFVSRDITESKSVQERVRNSEERLRTIFDSSPIGIIQCNENYVIIDLNPAVRRIFGISDHENLAGISLISSFGFSEEHSLEIQNGHTVIYETTVNPQDLKMKGLPSSTRSGIIEVRVNITPLHIGMAGVHTGYLVLVEDISEARKSVRLLRESEAFNRGLVTNLPDYIMVYNQDGIILYVNPSGVIGMRAEYSDLVGKSMYQFIIPGQREIVENQMRRRLANERVSPYEIRILRYDGSLLDVMVQATMIPYEGSDAVLVVLTDITSRKAVEEELEKYTHILQMTVDALATANKKLNLLSDVTRHDILNQIHIIFGYLDILKDANLSEHQKHVFDRIEEAVSIIHRQIQFTRSYQDLGVNSPEWQNLNDIIGNLSHPLVSVISNISNVMILADPLLPKVFENLLDNSVRHGGEITRVEISVEEDSDNISMIWSDNGKGIASSDKAKIFEKGYGSNTGFGLFLIQEILSLTGISIHETGVEGIGARFVLGIPKGSFRITS